MPQQERVPFPRGSNGDGPRALHRNNGENHGSTVGEHPRLFSGISPADYTEICRVARVKQFDRGEMLHLEGDSIERVLLLTSGSVKITRGMAAALTLGRKRNSAFRITIPAW